MLFRSLESSMHDRAIGMAVGHAGRPDPETARRAVPSAWPGSWAGSADSSGLTQLPTSIFHFPVETGEFDARSGYRDGHRTCRPAGPRDCPSVRAVGMAGQLGSTDSRVVKTDINSRQTCTSTFCFFRNWPGPAAGICAGDRRRPIGEPSGGSARRP